MLVGLYPVLTLLAINRTEIPLTDGIRSVLAALVLTGGLLLIYSSLLKNRPAAGLLASLTLLLFFSYGHVYLFLEGQRIGDFLPGRHRFVLPIYLVVFAALAWWVVKQKENTLRVIPGANLIAGVLLIFPMIQLLAYPFQGMGTKPNSDPSLTASLTLPEPPPDIYYIILDGYPRADILEQTFGFDNSDFLEFLSQKGFSIAACSQANYQNTLASLASSLNMTYLDAGDGTGRIRYADATLETMIQDSGVQRIVEGLGYTTVNFETGYKWLQWEKPDLYLSAFSNPLDRYQANSGLNEFEILLMRTSAALLLFDLQVSQPQNQTANFYELLSTSPKNVHRERLQFNFRMLPEIAATVPGPKFVYAHITFPHPPYLYGPQGQKLQNEPADLLAAYRDQVIYLNSNLEAIITALLELSATPPILIVQSDHGAVLPYEEEGLNREEKMAIFSAYSLPNGTPDLIGPTLTPVNTFRLVFDHYFDGDFGLLEDQSFFKDKPIQLPCSTATQ